jgi:hypothetical protein
MRAFPTIAQEMSTRFFEPKRTILEPLWKVSTVKDQEYAEGDGVYRISGFYFCRIPHQYILLVSILRRISLSQKFLWLWIIRFPSQNLAFLDG